MKLGTLKILIPAIALLVVGCRTVPRTMYVVERAPIVASRALSMAEVEKGIRAGGASSGWVMTTRGPGDIEGSYMQAQSTAVVAVTYDTTSFSIKYKDSVNLRYDAGGAATAAARGVRNAPATGSDQISVHYNAWVQSLERSIRAQLATF